MQQKAGDCGDRARFRFPYGSWQPRNSHVRLAGEEATGRRGTTRSEAGRAILKPLCRRSRKPGGMVRPPHDQFVIVDLCLGADGRRGEGKTLPARAMITLGPLQIPVFPFSPCPLHYHYLCSHFFAQPIPPRGARSSCLGDDVPREVGWGPIGCGWRARHAQVGRSVDEVLSHHASD